MSREIKFRIYKNKKILKIGDCICVNGEKYKLKEIYFDSNRWDSEKEGILMQYTGLLDSSGREIYEDDIIHIGGWRYARQVVKFRNGAYRGINKYVGEGFVISELLKTNVVSVVGNIYDTPELIADYL